MQVDLEAVGDRVVVDARGETADADERVAVEASTRRDRAQLVWRIPRMPAAASADVNAELLRARIQPALQRADDRGRDA
jgi:hypothetical protein